MESIDTTIDGVTVYREGALVRRIGILPAAAPATGEWAVGGLPLCLDDSSVRAGLSDSEGANGGIRDVRVVLEVPDGGAEAMSPGPKGLKSAAVAVRKLHAELSVLESNVQRIADTDWPNRPMPEDITKAGGSPLAARSEYSDYLEGRLGALLEKQRLLTAELKAANEALEALEDQERRATSARRDREKELRKTVVLRLGPHEPGAKPMPFFIEYSVPGARWMPSYNLRFDRQFTEAVLESRALVGQFTGEDWSGVDLTVSTALPGHWYDLPELGSKRIGRAVRSVSRSGWKAPPPGTDDLFRDYDKFMVPRSVGFGRLGMEDEEYPDEADDFVEDEEVYASETFSESEEEMSKDSVRRLSVSQVSEPVASASRVMKKSRSEPPAELAAPMKSSAAGQDFRSPSGPAGEGMPFAEEGGVSRDMLDYDILRLAEPESERRSRLIPQSRDRRYVEMLADRGMPDSGLLDVIRAHEDRARNMSSSPPPSNCIAPDSLDGYDYAYRTGAPVSIDSDGQFHSVSLEIRPVPASMGYIVVPRLDRSVFATAKVSNEGQAPILPGPVDIFVESDSLASGHFDAVPAGGTAHLGLGAEEGIKVARNARFREQTSGLGGGNLALKHELRIEVMNNLRRRINLEVRERIPTNPTELDRSDDKVKIEIGAVNPVWEPFEQAPDDIDGGFLWRIDLEAGERKELAAAYDIQIPSSMEIVGGNNREAE